MEHIGREINELLALNDNADIALEKINKLFSRLEIGTQLELHSSLSLETLKFFHQNLTGLHINDGVKEHIVWWYFKSKFMDVIVDNDFQDLLLNYKKLQYLSLESIAIALLKENRLSASQVKDADTVFLSKAYKRECYAHSCQNNIIQGNKLEVSMVKELLEYRLYSLLESAILHNSITKEGLQFLCMPYKETADKKLRLKLANLAQMYV